MMTNFPPGPDHQIPLLLEVVESASEKASESVVVDFVVDRDTDQGSPLPEANRVARVRVHEKLEQRSGIAVVELGQDFRRNVLAHNRLRQQVREHRLSPTEELIKGPEGRLLLPLGREEESVEERRGRFHDLSHLGLAFLLGGRIEVGVECGQKAFEFREHERGDFGAHRHRGAERCLRKPFVHPRQVFHDVVGVHSEILGVGSRAVLRSSSCVGIARRALESVMFCDWRRGCGVSFCD